MVTAVMASPSMVSEPVTPGVRPTTVLAPDAGEFFVDAKTNKGGVAHFGQTGLAEGADRAVDRPRAVDRVNLVASNFGQGLVAGSLSLSAIH